MGGKINAINNFRRACGTIHQKGSRGAIRARLPNGAFFKGCPLLRIANVQGLWRSIVSTEEASERELNTSPLKWVCLESFALSDKALNKSMVFLMFSVSRKCQT
ncbi:hypothetical protein CDAR_195881 [Caerostris darwini]|uniref:Uncharacterized protein n=1 Tax=Caerostris darwini TaxID=1538125 RepID=A0AAV4WQ88_9ARAC|nr:hypothetical protein CDAR_195881 [Caerostris darwini]